MTPFIYINQITMNCYKRPIGVVKGDSLVLYYNLTLRHTSNYRNGAALLSNIRLHRRPDETLSAVGL